MDNLKSFLDTVMTSTSTTTNNRDVQPTTVATTNKVTSSIVGGAAGSSFVAKAPAQEAENLQLKVSNSPTIGGGRFRSESESSVASDISIMSEMGGGVVGRDQRPMVKRKDSEPYFWIM